MKKTIKSLSLIILTLAICFSAVACTFIQLTGGTGGGNNTPTLPDASIQGLTVNLNTQTETERQKLSLEDAVAMVDRTAVAIGVDYEDGSSSGSGVIIDVADTGNIIYIVTCHHIVANGGSIKIYLPDETCNYENEDYIFTGVIGGEDKTSNAVTLVGGDRVSDVAVVKIDLSKPAVSGNVLPLSKIQKAKIPVATYNVKKGERVFAIGNPTGKLPGSVADGVVSFLQREVQVDGVGKMLCMQISVSTNPGNSGGGLYNLYGELIGITNAGNTSYESINYAIPLELSTGNGFVNIVRQLIGTETATNYGYVKDRWELGFVITLSSNSYKSYIEIIQVLPGSNAERAGLKVGDVLNGMTVGEEMYTFDTYANFTYYMALLRTIINKGDSVTFNVLRPISSISYEPRNIKLTIEVANFIFMNTGK